MDTSSLVLLLSYAHACTLIRLLGSDALHALQILVFVYLCWSPTCVHCYRDEKFYVWRESDLDVYVGYFSHVEESS